MRLVRVMLALVVTLGGMLSAMAPTSWAQAVSPVLEIGERVWTPEPGMGVLLGGVAEGRLMTAKALAPFVRGGETYSLYTLTGRLKGSFQGSKVLPQESPLWDLMVKLTPAPPVQKSIFGVAGSWNALPRTPQFLSTDDDTYKALTTDLLKKKGIATPRVRLTQVIKIDLAGDGTAAVLVAATYFAHGVKAGVTIKAGDYSVVYLRQVVAGKAQTYILGGEFHPQDLNQNLATEFKVGAVLDLDGDGVMEIVIHSRYYEGAGTEVFKLQNNRPLKVMEAGWGA